MSELNNTGFTLVLFHTDWCGHCKKLDPKYKKAAEILHQHNMKLHAVNCQTEAELCQSHNVTAYPTLKAFINGTYVKDYPDSMPREIEAIVEYVKKGNSPSFSMIESEAELSSLLQPMVNTTTEMVVLALIPDNHPEKMAMVKKFAKAAADNDHIASFSITHMTNHELLKPFSNATFLIISKNITALNVSHLEGDIIPHVHRAKLPLFGKLDEVTYETYTLAKLPIGFLFASSEDGPSFEKLMVEVAKQFSGLISIAWIDSALYGSHASTFGLSGTVFPCFTIHDMEGGLKYPLPENSSLTVESLTTFIDSALKGKIAPYFKSEAIPSYEEGASVRKLVYNNFDSVLNSTKATLVKFYAPWCKACARLAPHYIALADAFKNQSDKIEFTEYDLENNELPMVIESTIRMIPALYLFQPNAQSLGEFIKFEGEPYKAKIADFIVSSCSNQIDAVEVDSDDVDRISEKKPTDADAESGYESFDEHEEHHDDEDEISHEDL